MTSFVADDRRFGAGPCAGAPVAKIAAGVDEVGPEKTQLFLAKLALVLAREVGDVDVVRAAIANASRDLD